MSVTIVEFNLNSLLEVSWTIRNTYFSLLRQKYPQILTSGEMLSHPGGWDKPIQEVILLWRHRTSTPNNLEKSRLLCVLDIFCTFLGKNEKNNQSPHWGRDWGIPSSCPRRQDLQHPRLGKPRRGLQILDTGMGFPHPSLNVVLDSINLWECKLTKVWVFCNLQCWTFQYQVDYMSWLCVTLLPFTCIFEQEFFNYCKKLNLGLEDYIFALPLLTRTLRTVWSSINFSILWTINQSFLTVKSHKKSIIKSFISCVI